jgi:hypothetical protein
VVADFITGLGHRYVAKIAAARPGPRLRFGDGGTSGRIDVIARAVFPAGGSRMSHFPKNHRLRPVYRFLAFLAGLYCLVFGIVGVIRTHDFGTFEKGSVWAMGLKTNLGFSILSVIVGLLVIGVTVIGHNLDRAVNMVLGPGFILVGILMMTIMETSANVFNFGMSTCVVSFVIGLVLMAGAFYGEVAPERRARAEEHFRLHGGPDPEHHPRTVGEPYRDPSSSPSSPTGSAAST